MSVVTSFVLCTPNNDDRQTKSIFVLELTLSLV